MYLRAQFSRKSYSLLIFNMEMIDEIYEIVDDKRVASFSRKCTDADYVITNETYSAMKDVTCEDTKTKEL